MRSHLHTHEPKSVAQYNSNNAWIFNGTNGCLNNNNKINANGCRSLDYNLSDYSRQGKFIKFHAEMHEAWVICRKTKRDSHAQLEFEYNLIGRVYLSLLVWLMEYVPEKSIGFIIDIPRVREVIAAFFGDRVVQTWYNERLKPYLESDWLDDDSYSCRKGKGALAAALELKDKIERVSNGFIYDNVWLVKRDFRAFFMSVDTELLENLMVDFIMEHFGMDEDERNRLIWLTRIIYRSLPQERMIKKSHPLAWLKLESRKSMIGKIIGLPIGNVTSQTAANFITTLYLRKLREKGYEFVHYTDDTVIIVRDLEQWKRDEKEIEEYISSVMHLEWHKHKKYCQHYSKGVEFLGLKIRFDRLLPSDRIAHNFIWKTKCAVRRAEQSDKQMLMMTEDFQCVFNSYCGLLKWSNSNRLKGRVFEILKDSKLSRIYDIHGIDKITIKKNRTRMAYYMRLNRKRKRKTAYNEHI